MKCPKESHMMPNGKMMTGKKHTAKSVMCVPKSMPKAMMVSIPKKVMTMR